MSKPGEGQQSYVCQCMFRRGKARQHGGAMERSVTFGSYSVQSVSQSLPTLFPYHLP